MTVNRDDGKDKGRTTILIVENHASVRSSLREWLGQNFENARFLEAESGEKGIELSSTGHPDIILMDIGLPGIDGIEATNRIKTLIPRSKIVMLSVYESSKYMTEAARAGASAYVIKREMGSKLLDTIRNLLPLQQ